MLPTAQAPFQSASLYVGDLHFDVNEGILFELFNRVGPVASIRVCRDAITRRSLGYAYVNFHNVSDAERALDTMNFTDIKGKPCRIMWSQRDPTLRRTGAGNIYIKNLPESVDNKHLFDIFSTFGNILSAKVATDENGKSKGYGYVHFEGADAAAEAIRKINGMLMDDSEVTVTMYVRKDSRAGHADWTNLYVKHFPQTWSEQDLATLFSEFGTITSIAIKKNDEGVSAGFGFVNFEKHSDAAAALAALNGKVIENGQNADGTPAQLHLYVSQAQKKSDRVREQRQKADSVKQERIMKLQGMNLFVKNFDDKMSEDALRDLFAPYGTITSARIMKDDSSGSSKGFGFVCFSSPEEASAATTELNGKIINGKPLFVNFHQRKEQRAAHLANTYGHRSNMQGGFMNQPPMPYMMYGGAGGPGPRFPMVPGMAGGPGRGAGSPRGGPFRGGNGPYPMPAYVQNGGRGGGPGRGQMMMVPPNQQGNRGMRPQGGRGMPVGGRGMPPAGMPMQQPGRGAVGVKFNMQARNQPMMMPMSMPQMQQDPVESEEATSLVEMLARSDHQSQKNILGEHLYPLIMQRQPQQAGKITGMLLEMDNAELLHLIESPEALNSKIEEALDVLRKHNAEQ